MSSRKRASQRNGSLIGLDVGTTGARALAIDLEGQVLGSATADYPMLTPRPGWTEQDPEWWWTASLDSLQRLTSELDEPPLALGLTGQMHGAVFLDGSAHVIRPALLWNDQRTARQCERIDEKVGAQRLLEITGNRAITGFQSPKILWLREEEPRSYERLRHVLLPKDYIRYRLTGELATDASDASGTLLLDLRSRNWSKEILGRLEIPIEWLPAVHEGPDEAGRLRADVAGMRKGLVVAAGAGDNAAAAVGNGVVEAGIVSSSIGTSGVVFAHSDTPRIDPDGRIQSFCHAAPGKYHLMGVTLAAGGAFRWWRDAARPDHDYEAMATLAAQAPPGAEGLVFLPYLSGERTPHLDPVARGAFVGLQLRHSAAHLTRAVMEGVVHSLKDCLDLVAGLGLAVEEIRATGGAARSQLWRQLQADIFGVPIRHNRVDEGPALGAALLAGVACGAFANVSDACSRVAFDPDITRPDPERHELYLRSHEVYSGLYEALAPSMHELHRLS